MTGDAEPLVLTLDIGTSSVRAMLWDQRGDWAHGWEAEIEHRMSITPDGGVETDAAELLKRTARSIDGVLEQAGKSASAIAAVGISTFWHSLMGVDDSGDPLTPLYTWADTRSRGAAAELKSRLDESAVFARTGCMLHSSYLPAKLLWLSETLSGTFGQVRSWVSFGEFLFLKLFRTPAVSISMASGTGLFNQDTCSWDPEMLSALPIRSGQLSPIVDADAPLSGLRGKWAKRWPALRDVPWYPALGDGACSNVGSNCTSEKRIGLMVGTSAALRVMLKEKQLVPPVGLWRYRLNRERILIGGALGDGGNLLRWLKGVLAVGKEKQVLRTVADLPPDGHGLTVLPFWAGERSPGYRSDARGAIVGLSLSTTSAEIVRASLEAISYRFAVLYDLLSQVAPTADETIVNGGAILQREPWIQITADVLGRPLIPSTEREATSRGAALMALQARGAIASIDAASDRFGEGYQPHSDRHRSYQVGLSRQKRLYDVLLPGTAGGAPAEAIVPAAEAVS